MRCILIKQLAIIILLITMFVIMNSIIYVNFTYRYLDKSPEIMRESAIELDKYLPFDDNSRIVKLNTDFRLSGKLPVLDGATALFPIYSAFVNVAYSEESVHFDGLIFKSTSRLQKTGTTRAYKAIVDGNADIIFVAKPSQEQLEYAENSGIDLIYVPIGYEAFVFFVNSKNTVQALTMEQIRGIYSGKYKNWSEVGGEKSPIIAVQRVDGSGSQTAMAAFMEGAPLMNRPASIIGRAIGYSFRLYVSNLAGKNYLKLLAINGVEPTEENIRNRAYPLIDCFYAVYRADNLNDNIKILIEWILSDEGQSIIEKTGYVSVRN